MPPSSPANIWVAAGDGDLARVKHLVEAQAVSPNAPDPNTYTPMHAAASYGQREILQYLTAHGGDVNIADEDGDTPLYTVENVATASWLVQHGAVVDRLNSSGISPIAHLDEDFPDVAAYLRTVSTVVHAPRAEPSVAHPQPSLHAQDMASEHLTTALVASVRDIMQRAESDGRDPEDELRNVVGRTILKGVATGFGLAEQQDHEGGRVREHPDSTVAKKPRMDDGQG